MSYPDNNTAKITLSFPVNFNGKEYKELELRRPKVRDQIIADKQNDNNADKEIHLASLLANVDPGVIQELDMDDYTEVQKCIVGFRKSNSQSETSKQD